MRLLSLLFVYLLVLDSEGAVPAPVNAHVMSNNFIHILQWSPGKGTQPGTVYEVKVGNNAIHNISVTSVNISEHMKDKYKLYIIWLSASFGTSSSSKVQIFFTPYTSTIIGPPILSLSGCGNCLNISIELPNRQSSSNFYNAINFYILWGKVKDEKDDCHSQINNFQSKKSVPYSYTLANLQPGERYCVQAQPKVRSLPEHKQLNSCACEFTSRIEPRGGAFLTACVASSVLLGLSFLTFMFFLVYTGFLCKPNIRLPKALILVPGYFLSPEELLISVAELENNIQIQKPEDHQHKKKKKGKDLHKNNDDGDDDDEDDVDEDDDNEDEESNHGYMDRGVPSESVSTDEGRSASDCEAAENPKGCSFEDTLTHTTDTLMLSQVQYKGVKQTYSLGASLDPVMEALIPPSTKGGEKLGEEIKKKEEEEKDCGNVNLWSVVLKSMQPEEEEAKDPNDVKEPLLPLLLKELGEHLQTGSSSELHTALLCHTQTEAQSSQEEELDDISDTSVCDHMQTGYMASHTGAIDTEYCSFEDKEEDCTSGYMTR
ncbi:cytokine receptor family member b1 isoform X2 [Tachysurus fulvidraco]|uniref:cytokine receptor family member b1 isoform X2 n=1 Tax=Tachysurus fulvidraco TaxID=1234273 RepID=UPI000F5129BA|nr:cytokine receptor family member b1 isoform X2 [Tachysurus fulvidraco]